MSGPGLEVISGDLQLEAQGVDLQWCSLQRLLWSSSSVHEDTLVASLLLPAGRYYGSQHRWLSSALQHREPPAGSTPCFRHFSGAVRQSVYKHRHVFTRLVRRVVVLVVECQVQSQAIRSAMILHVLSWNPVFCFNGLCCSDLFGKLTGRSDTSHQCQSKIAEI